VNLTSENPVPIEEGQKLSFTYTVHWKKTTQPFESRFNRYLEYDFFEHKIHWFSIFNSFMMVVFLCGLVSLILLRTLRNDFARYAKDEDLDVEGMQVIGEDTGWKQVHGDVFRPPECLEFFSAIIGTGWQLAVLVLFVIFYAMLGTSFPLNCVFFYPFPLLVLQVSGTLSLHVKFTTHVHLYH
jgi:transmembrane 9 superfamily member 3